MRALCRTFDWSATPLGRYARRLVHLRGGDLTAASAPGDGSRLVLTLPQAPATNRGS
jgi:signal transduction histidine kinase